MRSSEFQKKIVASWWFLKEKMDIARTMCNGSSLNVDQDFNKIALDPASTYQEIYLGAVSRSYYNIILSDYSIFQYSWNRSQSCRLAYLPNPWISGVDTAQELIEEWEVLESLGWIGQEEVSGLISELPYHSSIPSIRFEYAADQYRELSHPAAHLHIGRHAQNRWPVTRVLNPLSFTMMIAKMYYSARWAQLSAFCDHRVQDCLDLRFIQELSQSPLVPDFTDNERRSLHIASR